MLLFEQSKKLEKALGEESASVIAEVLEEDDQKWRQELATKADLMEARKELEARIEIGLAQTKHDILRWMMGGFLAQTALLVAIMAIKG